MGHGLGCESVLLAAFNGYRDVLALLTGCAAAMLFHVALAGSFQALHARLSGVPSVCQESHNVLAIVRRAVRSVLNYSCCT